MFEKYFEHGLKIVKVAKRGKNPIATEWQNNYAKTIEEVDEWVAAGFNIGVILEAQCGIVDVEIDSPEAQERWNELGIECYTPTFSGRRGPHRLFRVPEAYKAMLPKKTVVKPYGIEFRIGNAERACQSVFPPSVHESGHDYQWLPECSIDDYEDFAELPEELFRLLLDESTWETSVGVRGRGGHIHQPGDYDLARDGASEGGRNNALWQHSFRKNLEYDLSSMDRDVQKILLEELGKANEKHCDPPLSKHEVDQVFHSSMRTAKERQQKEREEFNIFADDKPPTKKEKDLVEQINTAAGMLNKWSATKETIQEEIDELTPAIEKLVGSGVDVDKAQKEKHPKLSFEEKELRKKLKRLDTLAKQQGTVENNIETNQTKLDTRREKLKGYKNDRGTAEPTADEFAFYETIGLHVSKEVIDKKDWTLEVVESRPPSYCLRIPTLSRELDSVGGVVALTMEELDSAQKVALAIQSATGYVKVNHRKSQWDRIWHGRANATGVYQQLLDNHIKIQPHTAGENRHVQSATKVRDVLAHAVTNEHVDTPNENGSPLWRKDGTLWFSWDHVWEIATQRTSLTLKDGNDLKRRLLKRLEKTAFETGSFTHKRNGVTTHYVVWRKSVEYEALNAMVHSADVPDVESDEVAPCDVSSNPVHDQTSETIDRQEAT